jgi:hypothetical protein
MLLPGILPRDGSHAAQPGESGQGVEVAGEPEPARTDLAARLADAQRRMADLDVPAPQAARLRRQFIAVCDAVKALGADEAAGERRLSAFLATLDRATRSSSPRI